MDSLLLHALAISGIFIRANFMPRKEFKKRDLS